MMQKSCYHGILAQYQPKQSFFFKFEKYSQNFFRLSFKILSQFCMYECMIPLKNSVSFQLREQYQFCQPCLCKCQLRCPHSLSYEGSRGHHAFLGTAVKVNVFVAHSCLTLATLWTVACQAPLSIEFSWQEYCSGLPFPSPRDLPNPGTEPGSAALQADSLPSELPGRPRSC